MSQKQHIEQYHLHKLHPEKMQFEVYDLHAYRNKNVEKAAIPHSHSYYQIIWFFEQGGSHLVDFTSYDIHANTVFFVNKDQIHAFDQNLDAQGYLIHFNESFFMQDDMDVFLKYNIFNIQQKPCYSIDDETVSITKSHVDLILKERAKSFSFGHEDAVRFLLKSLLINLERVSRTNVHEKLEINNQYVLQFVRYQALIEERFKETLSVTEYAALLNISTKTLSTVTKSIVNKTPSQLIVERTMLEAKRLLKFTSLQVGEIAFRLGFEDDSYFIKYFKKHVGTSPRSFRNDLMR
ncbi:MAG: helix-turn-helix domain-containing protein [Bacteroidia bacterium]